MAKKKKSTRTRSQGSPKRPGEARPAVAPAGVPAAEVGRLLRGLPGLVCGREMEPLAFSRDALLTARATGEAPPRTIQRHADPAFHARLLICLNEVRRRALREADETLRFLADAARYYVEGVRGPPWDNPLVVACYYRDMARLEGRAFSPQDAEEACAAYERDHQALLEQMLAEHGGASR